MDAQTFLEKEISGLLSEEKAPFTAAVIARLQELLHHCITEGCTSVQQLDPIFQRTQNHQTEILILSDGSACTIHNTELATYMHTKYTSNNFQTLVYLLEQKWTSHMQTHTATIESGGEQRPVTILNASAGEWYNMTDVRLRDQTFAAHSELRRRQCNAQQYAASGVQARDMLISLLNIVSNESDLWRIDQLIEHQNDPEYMIDHQNHPHIKRHVVDNKIEGINNRSHKQDARQQLVAVLCEAITSRLITANDLQSHHKTRLAHITKLMQALQYSTYRNAWSWEEIDAERQSTVLCAINALLGLENIQHIDGFERLQLESSLRKELLQTWTRKVTSMWLHESPSHHRDSLRHRNADAALLYRLVMDTQEHLSQLLQDAPLPEDIIAHVMEHLYDPTTWGIKRYRGDSYQQAGMYTHVVWHQGLLAHNDNGQQAEWWLRVHPEFRDKTWVIHYAGRALLLKAITTGIQKKENESPSSRAPLSTEWLEAWRTHPHFQIAARAARRYVEIIEHSKKDETEQITSSATWIGLKYEKYLQNLYTLATDAYNRWLAMITGTDEYVVRPSHETMEIQQIWAWLVPECRLYHINACGETITTPWPRTPLFWWVACLREASTYMEKMIILHESVSTLD